MKMNRRYKKVPKNNFRNIPYDSDNNFYSLNKADMMNVDDESDDEEKEYCVQNCLTGRKYLKGNEMIRCDNCFIWYHPTCINMTDSEFLMLHDTNAEWICNHCKMH